MHRGLVGGWERAADLRTGEAGAHCGQPGSTHRCRDKVTDQLPSRSIPAGGAFPAVQNPRLPHSPAPPPAWHAHWGVWTKQACLAHVHGRCQSWVRSSRMCVLHTQIKMKLQAEYKVALV